MSLFKWSTPERRRADQVLPLIPNEIYICIFERIAPPTGRLTPEELGIFSNLSRICRFFANFCLPRIFEFVVFSGSIFQEATPSVLRNDAIYKPSREAMLCSQITAKQPLALSLAQRVRSCHFTHWHLEATGLWALQLFAKKYLAAMVHMKNVRELKFSASFVDAEHWRAIASLQSLEELSFDSCTFLRGPADLEPEERVRVKVPRLRVTNCIGHRQPIAAIDPRYLRALTADCVFSDEVDWLPQCALTELHLWPRQPFHRIQPRYLEQVFTALTQAPRSLEALWLSADITTGVAQGVVRRMFDDPAWKNLPLLRSLTLQVLCEDSDTPENVLSFVLDCIALLTDLRSLTLERFSFAPTATATEVSRILRDELGPSSSLTYADIYGKVFCLVDKEWSEVHS